MRADRLRQIGLTTLLLALVGVAPLFAQDVQAPDIQAPDTQMTSPEPVVFLSSNMVQGDLLRVDVEAQRFVVKQANGLEVELVLNRRTTITGVDDVRELALRAGSRVSVRFSRHAGDKVATSIRVHPKIETVQRREFLSR